MPTIKVQEPSVEPLTLQQLKAWTRIEVSTEEDDALLEQILLPGVREAIEGEIGRTFIATKYLLQTDGFSDALRLEYPRILSVDSVVYVDPDGVERTLHPDDYRLDNASDIRPGWLVPAFGRAWPATRREINAVRVRYVAGFGTDASAVPACVKQCIAAHAAYYYEHRTESIKARSGLIGDAMDQLRVWG